MPKKGLREGPDLVKKGRSGGTCPWFTAGKPGREEVPAGFREDRNPEAPDPAPGMEACPAEVLGSAVKVTLTGQPQVEDYVKE